MSRAQAITSKDENALNEFYRQIVTERVRGLPDLKRWPCDPRNDVSDQYEGFYEEMAFFVPLERLFNVSAQCMDDALRDTPSQRVLLSAWAFLMRAITQPMAGTISGMLSSASSITASHLYHDWLDQKMYRDKVRVFFYWMVRDTNTDVLDPHNEGKFLPLLRHGNITGILVRALSVDPMFRFDDAIEISIIEAKLANDCFEASKRQQEATMAFRQVGKKLGKALDMQPQKPPASHVLTACMYPERSQPQVHKYWQARYEEALAKTEATLTLQYLGEVNKQQHSEWMAECRAARDAQNALPAEPTPLTDSDLDDEQKEQIKTLAKKKCSFDTIAEYALANQMFMTQGEHNEAMFDLSVLLRDVGILRTSNLIMRNKSLPPESERFTLETIGTVINSYERFVEQVYSQFTVLGATDERRRAASVIGSYKRAAQADAAQLASISAPRCLTLENALSLARTYGTAESLLHLRSYYSEDSQPYQPPRAGEDHLPRVFGQQVEYHARFALGGMVEREANPHGTTDVGAAPWRASHPLYRVLIAWIPPEAARLHSMRNWRFPWTENTLPEELDRLIAGIHAPTPEEAARLAEVLSVVQEHTNQLMQHYHGNNNGGSGGGGDSEDMYRHALLPMDPVAHESRQRVNSGAAVDDDEAGADGVVIIDGVPQMRTPEEANRVFEGRVGTGKEASTSVDSPISTNEEIVIRDNFDHLRERLLSIESKMAQLRAYMPDTFAKLVPRFREFCLREYSRVYNSSAPNNGLAMRSILAYQRHHGAKGACIDVRAISSQLSRMGNVMASQLLGLRAALGIVTEPRYVLWQLTTSRVMVPDMEWAKLHLWYQGQSSQGKSHNAQVIEKASVQGTVRTINHRTGQSDQDMLAEGKITEYTDEAPFVITHSGVPKSAVDAMVYNNTRIALSEGVVCVARSDRGKATIHFNVLAKTTRVYNSNFSNLPLTGDMSMVWRLWRLNYRTTNQSKHAGDVLFIRQFMPRMAAHDVNSDVVFKMWQWQQVLCANSVLQSNCFALPRVGLEVVNILTPWLVQRIEIVYPRLMQYIRQALRIKVRCVAWAHVRAVDLVFNSPLSPFTMQRQGRVLPFDVMQLQALAPHLFVTEEMFMWSMFCSLEEFMDKDTHVVLSALAMAHAHWAPHLYEHLFIGDRDAEMRESDRWQTQMVDGVPKLVIYGHRPEHFGRAPGEMPEFWQREEWEYTELAKKLGVPPRYVDPRTNTVVFTEVTYRISPDPANQHKYDQNYVTVHVAGSQASFSDIAATLLGNIGGPNVDTIRPCLLFITATNCNVVKMPQLRSSVDNCRAPAEWQVDAEGNVVVKSMPLVIHDEAHSTLHISTLFLYWGAQRFIKMNLLAALEDHHTVTGERWLLSDTVTGEAALFQVYQRRQRRNHFISIQNPFGVANLQLQAGRSTARRQDAMINMMHKPEIRTLLDDDRTDSVFTARIANNMMRLAQNARRFDERRKQALLYESMAGAEDAVLPRSVIGQLHTCDVLKFETNPLELDAYYAFCEQEGISIKDANRHNPRAVERALREIETLERYHDDSMSETFSADVVHEWRQIHNLNYPDDLRTNTPTWMHSWPLIVQSSRNLRPLLEKNQLSPQDLAMFEAATAERLAAEEAAKSSRGRGDDDDGDNAGAGSTDDDDDDYGRGLAARIESSRTAAAAASEAERRRREFESSFPVQQPPERRTSLLRAQQKSGGSVKKLFATNEVDNAAAASAAASATNPARRTHNDGQVDDDMARKARRLRRSEQNPYHDAEQRQDAQLQNGGNMQVDAAPPAPVTTKNTLYVVADEF